jgi:hypothetical protein
MDLDKQTDRDMDLQEFLRNGDHLPEFIKDFHDQKDLFKAIYEQWQEENDVLKNISWVDAHVFSIDVFLWWMGLHGYKLQKVRKQGLEFYDPQETIQHFNDIRKGKINLTFI